ncbi:MAG: protein kinase domain-containing protein [Persicimonas sp.]
MKVCPECQARFDSGETFCPHDGTRLVEAQELSPGQLTGQVLGESISLERLEFVDELGERYNARLEDSTQKLRVTVFNQGLTPDTKRMPALERGFAGLGATVPPELLSLHSLSLEGSTPFVAEQAPTGPSLRALIEERSALSWQPAVRLICSVGRALEYLHDHNVPHHCVHPRAIFVSDLSEGRIQLGEWVQGLLCYREHPLEVADEDPEAFLGYGAYLAPEAVRDGGDTDKRSLVYAMGMLLYELIAGKPPFTSKTPAETLKRQLHEKPLKLSIAVGGAGLHPELDDILDMMWVKAPERRFHTPAAAISALGSLLEEAPTEVAPELVPADEPVFSDSPSTTAVAEPDEAVDADEDSEDQPDSADKKTAMGMPAVSVVGDSDEQEEVDEAGEADEPDDPDETEQADAADEPDETEQADAADEPDETEQADAADESDQAEESDESPSIIIDDPELRDSAAGDEASDAELEASDDEAEKSDAEVDESRQTEPIDDEEANTLMMGSSASTEDGESGEAGADAEDGEASEVEDSEEAEDEDESPKQTLMMGSASDVIDEDEADADEEDTGEEDTGEEDTGEEDTGEEDTGEDEADADEEDADEEDADAPQIGFVETENDGGGEFAEDWFSTGANESWDRAHGVAHEDGWENLRKYVTIGVFVALGLGAVGLYFFFENYTEPAEESEESVEAEQDDQDDEVDLEALRADFDNAFDKGHLMRPRRGSAVSFLEELKRHGADDPIYEEARKKFATQAASRAREVEQKDLQYARDLAGFATQFDPDNKELSAYSDELHERFISRGENAEADAGAGTDAGAEADADGATASDKESDDEAKRDDSTGARADQQASNKPAAKKKAASNSGSSSNKPSNSKSSGSSKPSVSDLLADAQAAEKSGDKDEATALYGQVIRRSPSNHRAHAALGDILFHKAAYSQALGHHRKAADLQPANVSYAVSLGRTHFKLGHYQKAHNAWQKALERDPDNSVANRYIELVKKKL